MTQPTAAPDSLRPSTLRVRMYQVGFGDAFLLSFEYDEELNDGRDRRHVLIDFGSTSPPKSPKKLDAIADQVYKHTGGEIDVIVVTHRHKDHLSAFASPAIASKLCKSGYPKLVVRSWTENPQITQNATGIALSGMEGSNAIAGHSMAFVRSLTVANEFAQELATRFAAMGIRSRSLAARVKQAAEDQISNAAAVGQLERWADAGRASYLHYGLASGIEEYIPGICVRVLGPPTVDQHRNVLTQRQSDAREFWMLYRDMVRFIPADVLLTAARPGPGDSSDSGTRGEEDSGAEGEEVVALGDGGADPVAAIHEVPVGPIRWLTDRMERQQLNSWLRIVHTLDAVLNNTSIILLFEVPRSNGQTARLLFPGDAQIENWEYALKYAQDAVANRDVLRHVDLYKVGHHGSRNATPHTLYNLWNEPKTRDHPLVALMSTKPGVHGRSSSTSVPRKTLVAALDTRTRGRLYSSENLSAKRPFIELQMDLNSASEFSEVAQPPSGLST